MKLSVVATLYQSAPYLEEFHRRVTAAAGEVAGDDYEIVLVNDGSPDASLPMAVGLAERDDRVVVVDLSRNFGHHKAIMTGLAHARGELVFLIDCDLEEDPELLVQFRDRMRQDPCDVVFGVQESRKGGWFERVSGGLFWGVFRFLTGSEHVGNSSTVRLMTHRYVAALLEHQEREMFLGGILRITGFEQRPQVIVKHGSSPSTYSLRNKVALFVNMVTSFSSAPLLAIFYIGMAISVAAALYVLYLIFFWMFLGSPASGWTSVMASVWLLGGMSISFMGVIGIYLSKVFMEVKERPYTIVREVHGRRGGDSGRET